MSSSNFNFGHDRPLSAKTLARIEAGLQKYGAGDRQEIRVPRLIYVSPPCKLHSRRNGQGEVKR